MPTELSPTLLVHLRRAAIDPQGRLPAGISRRSRDVLLEAGSAYAEDGDGSRLTPVETRALPTSVLTITFEGRRAALTQPQLTALTTDVSTDGRLSPTLHWQTVHSLRALGLVEVRDWNGAAEPSGGGSRHAFRTGLGDSIAALPTP